LLYQLSYAGSLVCIPAVETLFVSSGTVREISMVPAFRKVGKMFC
jgi:hypothetical protein